MERLTDPKLQWHCYAEEHFQPMQAEENMILWSDYSHKQLYTLHSVRLGIFLFCFVLVCAP